MRQSLIILLLAAAGSLLAYLHVASQTYYPVVRVAAPEGLSYTVVQSGTSERRACGAANDRFLKPLKELCKQCRIIYARCERTLHGLEAALHDRGAVPMYVIVASGLSMAIEGRAAPARQACDFLASDMVKRGLRTAACVYPRMAQTQKGATQ